MSDFERLRSCAKLWGFNYETLRNYAKTGFFKSHYDKNRIILSLCGEKRVLKKGRFISTREFSTMIGVGSQRACKLCREGRFKTAIKIGWQWRIMLNEALVVALKRAEQGVNINQKWNEKERCKNERA